MFQGQGEMQLPTSQHRKPCVRQIGMECTKKTTKSLRKPRQIRPLKSRVSNLEKQIQHLASSLGDNPSRDRTESVSSAQSDYNDSPQSTGTPSFTLQSTHSVVTRPSSLPDSFQSPPAAVPPNGLTWPEASAILAIYRQKFMLLFPCVIVDGTVSAQQLLAERPFLFRAIMLAAAPISAARAKKMKRNVMAYLGHRLLVDEQRPLELLQGLLVLLSRNDLDYYHDSQITVLTYTALGLAYSLHLTKTPLGTLQEMGEDRVLDDAFQLKAYAPAHGHTIEEQRAAIGLYCVVSLNSTSFGRKNPLDTRYISICCDSLARARDSPDDFFLERIARMYLVADRISSMFGSPHDSQRPQPFLFLVEGHARSLRAELTDLMESLTFENLEVYQNGVQRHRRIDRDEYAARREFFTLHYHYLLVRLYEPATYLQNVPLGQPSQFRSACLRNCLLAAKAYLDAFVAVPPPVVAYASSIAREPLPLVVAVATRLMFLETPGWDLQFARSTLDICRSLDVLVEATLSGEAFRRQQAASFAKEVSGVDCMTYEEGCVDGDTMPSPGVERFRFLRGWYEAKVRDGDTTAWLDPAINMPLDNWDAIHSQLLATDEASMLGKSPSSAVVEVVDIGTGVPSTTFQSSVPVGTGDGGYGDPRLTFYNDMYGVAHWGSGTHGI
ncbi:Fungal transcriptional regulatory protein [Sarocladium implicatum]|nr:Fungal transcriptional regulatory protein [Sarocladium implicatum]